MSRNCEFCKFCKCSHKLTEEKCSFKSLPKNEFLEDPIEVVIKGHNSSMNEGFTSFASSSSSEESYKCCKNSTSWIKNCFISILKNPDKILVSSTVIDSR